MELRPSRAGSDPDCRTFGSRPSRRTLSPATSNSIFIARTSIKLATAFGAEAARGLATIQSCGAAPDRVGRGTSGRSPMHSLAIGLIGDQCNRPQRHPFRVQERSAASRGRMLETSREQVSALPAVGTSLPPPGTGSAGRSRGSTASSALRRTRGCAGVHRARIPRGSPILARVFRTPAPRRRTGAASCPRLLRGR